MSIEPAHDLNGLERVAERLRKLEEILAAPRAADSSGPKLDPADAMLSLAITERIARLTSELGRDRHADADAAEVLAMRMLLIEYLATVRHLRTAARFTEQRLSSVATTIAECDRLHTKQILAPPRRLS